MTFICKFTLLLAFLVGATLGAPIATLAQANSQPALIDRELFF
jgi:hypothetical protein